MVYQYNGLKEKITAHAGKECADFVAKITTATVGDVLASWYLKQYTTPATLAALQELPAGDPIPEAIKDRMQKKRAKEAERDAKKRFERVNEVEEVEAPAAVSVVVEWHKSRTWGMNPRARVATRRRSASQPMEARAGAAMINRARQSQARLIKIPKYLKYYTTTRKRANLSRMAWTYGRACRLSMAVAGYRAFIRFSKRAATLSDKSQA